MLEDLRKGELYGAAVSSARMSYYIASNPDSGLQTGTRLRSAARSHVERGPWSAQGRLGAGGCGESRSRKLLADGTISAIYAKYGVRAPRAAVSPLSTKKTAPVAGAAGSPGFAPRGRRRCRSSIRRQAARVRCARGLAWPWHRAARCAILLRPPGGRRAISSMPSTVMPACVPTPEMRDVLGVRADHLGAEEAPLYMSA